jgi:uncharacterized protein
MSFAANDHGRPTTSNPQPTNIMQPIEILEQHYGRNLKAFDILVAHGNQVAQKALKAAKKVAHLQPDLEFIEKAAMLHDVGIFLTHSPKLGCHGVHPYVCHGVLGFNLLNDAGWPQLALVCERHVGVGISTDDVLNYNLPLPKRDMLPISIEEQIICYADKFFSKNGGTRTAREKPVEEILANLKNYGQNKASRFQKWVEMFEG